MRVFFPLGVVRIAEFVSDNDLPQICKLWQLGKSRNSHPPLDIVARKVKKSLTWKVSGMEEEMKTVGEDSTCFELYIKIISLPPIRTHMYHMKYWTIFLTITQAGVFHFPLQALASTYVTFFYTRSEQVPSEGELLAEIKFRNPETL